MAVERFDGEYFEGEIRQCFFEQEMEFGRMQKHNGDLGTLDV